MTRLCDAPCQAPRYIGAQRINPKPTGVGGCTRSATYTDGKSCFCTQHAKEPPTVLRKASGRIRVGLFPMAGEPLRQAEALCAADERKAEGR